MDASINRRSGAATESRPNEVERSDRTGPAKGSRFPKRGRAVTVGHVAMAAALSGAP